MWKALACLGQVLGMIAVASVFIWLRFEYRDREAMEELNTIGEALRIGYEAGKVSSLSED